jgi:DNA ligase (NAD+)
LGIVVRVGRTGTLTPTALLKPVDVSGVTVSRATLHNQDFIEQKDVRIGDTVKIARAGDVIPEVTEVIKKERTGTEKKFYIPTTCPVCQSDVVKDGAFYRCTGGLTCTAQLKRSIGHFASKGAMNIDGLGEKAVELFVEKGLIKRVSDLFELTDNDLRQLPRFAEKSSRKLLQAIEASKNRPLSRFIYALGIPHVGEHIARLLAKSFGSLEKMMQATENELRSIYEIGPEIAESVVAFFGEQHNQEEIERLGKKGVTGTVTSKRRVTKETLQGKTFVFTGTLKDFSRDEVGEIVEESGGRISSSVSKKTDYVVVGKKPGSKYDKAKKYGVNCISEQEFKKLISKI